MISALKTLHVMTAILLAATLPQISSGQTTAEPTPVAPTADNAAAALAEESLLPPEEAIIFARKNGYRVAQVNGETMYCRRDRVTGSRVRSEERCYTRAQLTRISEAARRLLDEQTNRMTQPREGG